MSYQGKIYKITNKVNDKIYIGRTKHSLEERLKEHARDKRGVRPVKLAIDKYGLENFAIEQIGEAFTLEETMGKEKYWIKQLDARNKKVGYNMTEGGDDKRHVAKNLIDNRDYLIRCNETGETFKTYVDAAEAFGVSPVTISQYLKNGGAIGGKYTWSRVDKEKNEFTGPLNIERDVRHIGERRVKCVETGQVFESVGELATHIGLSYASIRNIIKKKTSRDGLSYEFVDKKARRDTKNGTAKISRPIKRLEDEMIFSSLAAMGRALGFSQVYASFVMNKMGGVCRGLHYVFAPKPETVPTVAV